MNGLVNTADGLAEKERHTADPLEGRHGMEEWSGEDTQGRTPPQKRHKGGSGDPLSGVSGTEEW